MLNISTGKNQSTEARGALYIPTREYGYKVITRCDKYYKNITSPTWRNCENTRMYKYEQYKWRLRVITGKLYSRAGGPGKMGSGRSAGDHATAAPL